MHPDIRLKNEGKKCLLYMGIYGITMHDIMGQELLKHKTI